MTSSTSPDKEPEGAANAPVSKPGRQAFGRLQAHVIFIFIASLVTFLPGLHAYGIIDPSDGLYAEAAREMLERSDIVTPSSNYQPFFEKPILIYWMILASYKILGVHEVSARLPEALCGALCAVALLLFVRPFLGARAALFAALALLSTPLFVAVGRIAVTDVPLTLFMMLAALGLFSRLQGAHWISIAIAYIVLGLALLLKGPVPVVLIVFLLLLYMLLICPKGVQDRYRWWWQKLSLLHPLLGAAVILSIAAPWYIVEGITTKGEFYQEFFIRQNWGRALGTVNHQNEFWFYAPVYLGGFFPWSILTLVDVRRYFALLKNRRLLTRRSHLEFFSLLWLLLILAIFSVLKAKLSTFILPAAPALAILSGSMLDRAIRFNKSRQIGWILLLVTLVMLPALLACVCANSEKIGLDTNSLCAFGCFGIFVWFFLIFAARAAFKKQTETAITAVACACAFACATFVPTGLQSYYVSAHYPLIFLLKRIVRDHAQVALYQRDSPAVTFYLRRPIKEIKTHLDYKHYVESGQKPHYLLVTTDIIKQMKDIPSLWVLLERRGKWHLFKIDP